MARTALWLLIVSVAASGGGCAGSDLDWTPPQKDDTRLVLQRRADDCGVAALVTLLGLIGNPVTYEEIARSVDIGPRGVSMHTLSMVATAQGVETVGYRFSDLELANATAGRKPWITLLGSGANGHYVVVRSVVGDTVSILDPSRGSRLVRRRPFEEMWTGYALLVP